MKTVLILEAEVRKNKKNEDYVVFSCRDLEGKEWEGCKIWDSNKAPEGIVDIEGVVKQYKGQDQLTVDTWKPAEQQMLTTFLFFYPLRTFFKFDLNLNLIF